MSDERSNEKVREDVSRAYAKAVSRTGGGGCCGESSCCSPAGFAAKTAGYGDEVAEVPAEAASSSFGCGNPVTLADLLAGETVLDLGSGAGLDLLLAARMVGPTGRVIGVDMTDEMLEAARRNVERAGVENVELRRGLIEALPVEDGSVDLVVSNCVINLSPEKERVFAEIRRVLAPGGRFSISDIVVEELPDSLREVAAVHAACVGGAISEADYVAGLEAAGHVDVSVVDRLVYDVDQLRGIVASDLDSHGLSAELTEEVLASVAGKVWSARFTGRRPGGEVAS